VVMRNDRSTDLTAETAKVEALLGDQAQVLEVKNWKQLMPVIARMIETADTQILIMLVIFYIAVATVVLNAMLMNVFERIHEFGIMKALGVSPMQLVGLVFAETFFLTLLAAVFGLATGWWVSDYYQLHGIDLSTFAGSITYGGIAFDPVWYGVLLMINLELAMITPPVGLNLFVTAGVAQMSVTDTVKAALPWVGIMFIFLILVTYVPTISTLLPTMLMGPEVIIK